MDLFDKLTDMRDRLDKLMVAEEKRAKKLEDVASDIDIQLALASALAALETASPYLRHSGPRSQVLGAKQQIKRILAA